MNAFVPEQQSPPVFVYVLYYCWIDIIMATSSMQKYYVNVSACCSNMAVCKSVEKIKST